MTQHFHSNDFDKTPPRPVMQLPDKLIHQSVESDTSQAAYSKERKHPVFFVDLPSLCLSMTIGHLEPGGSSNQHRHTYETILYVLEGKGYSEIGGKKIEWKTGDALYIPVWAWHKHVNNNVDKIARYLACENAPLLQNIGGIALREEVPDREKEG
ncbi:MAG: cupin domain-containing protein [Cyanobacteriota/Melainabacteria group bacterium]